MARVVDELPPTRQSKYRWNEWLDGRVWELTAGEDFTVSTKDVRTMAYMQGARRGCKVTSRVSEDGKHLYIQATLNQ